MREYRIRNTNQNLQIQRKVEKSNDKWKTISYHGHNLNSLISGLTNLFINDFTPEGDTLLDQLKSVELELNYGVGRIERIVREYCD